MRTSNRVSLLSEIIMRSIFTSGEIVPQKFLRRHFHGPKVPEVKFKEDCLLSGTVLELLYRTLALGLIPGGNIHLCIVLE